MRKPWILNLLLLAAVAVTAVRLWSFWQKPLPKLPSPVPAHQAEPAETSQAAPGAAGADENYEGIVARDLFSAARGVIPPAPQVVEIRKTDPPPQPPPKLTLYGVVILDADKTAFLQEGPQETKPRRIREGEMFAGGKVSAIRPDGVTLLFAGREVSVPLRTPKESVTSPGMHQPLAFPAVPNEQQPEQVVPFPVNADPASRQVRPPGMRFPEESQQAGQAIPPRSRRMPTQYTPPAQSGMPGGDYFPEEESPEGDMDEGDMGETLDEGSGMPQ